MGHAINEKAQPPESSGINNTFFRRALTVTATKLCWNIKLRPRCGTVLFLSRVVCVKASNYGDLAEAAAIQFIAKNTTIPVPKIYCAFRRKGITYIAMENMNGDILGKGWAQRSEESKARIFAQLKEMVRSMRDLKLPEGAGVENVIGEALFDQRLPGSSFRCGPFKGGVQEFHSYLRSGIEDTNEAEVNDMIRQHREGNWPLVFTHADLSSMNIILKGDKVVGIIDWETAGWYPSYWEYTTARNANPQNYWWGEEVDNYLEPMPKEWEMEMIRQRCFW